MFHPPLFPSRARPGLVQVILITAGCLSGACHYQFRWKTCKLGIKMQRTACGPIATTPSETRTPNTPSGIMANPSNVEYVTCDFLVIGAGSSGCVLASRLVRQGLKVVLIEAGPADGRKWLRPHHEWLTAASSGDKLSEVFMSTPQRALGGRQLPLFRGRGGGGTSNVNAALYQRGSKGDYEHWPWELEDVEASFKSVETELVLERRQSPGSIGPSYDRMLQEVGFKFTPPVPPPAGEEHEPRQNASPNDDEEIEETWTTLGLKKHWKTTTTDDGTSRRTAWQTFVNPVMTMPNLKIRDDSLVSRVIIEDGRAMGVELLECGGSWRLWPGGRRRTRQLRFAPGSTGEIVVCGGAFRTPKLLMLSGVGPRRHLEQKGVPVVVDSPHVGSNLQDHLLLGNAQLASQPMPEAECAIDCFHGPVYFSCRTTASSHSGEETNPHSGEETNPPPGSDGGAAGTGAAVAASTVDHSTERSPAPVLGFMYWEGGTFDKTVHIFSSVLLHRPGVLNMILRTLVCFVTWVVMRLTPLGRWIRTRVRGVHMCLTTVKSRGTVRLRSGDPTAPPDIDPAYLSHPDDARTCFEAWRVLSRATRDTVEGKATLGLELAPGSSYKYANDFESFLRWLKDTCLPFFHPVGTCRMGEGVNDSVVSSESLRVHGVAGLRVADASIAPRIPHTPTQAMAMMIGDRAAALALKDRFSKERLKANMAAVAGQSIN